MGSVTLQGEILSKCT